MKNLDAELGCPHKQANAFKSGKVQTRGDAHRVGHRYYKKGPPSPPGPYPQKTGLHQAARCHICWRGKPPQGVSIPTEYIDVNPVDTPLRDQLDEAGAAFKDGPSQ